jgi:transglutaminase-like putative cysteine protease
VQTYGLLARLCTAINKSLTYQAREQPGVQSAVDTLTRGVGSCRDFANLFMETAHFLGLAARFVSGYLMRPFLGHLGQIFP